MDKKQQDIAYFISFGIEQYKNAKGLSGEEVMQVFSKYGVLEYLRDFFDVLHTQSHQWLLANIDEFINLREKEDTRTCIEQTGTHLGIANIQIGRPISFSHGAIAKKYNIHRSKGDKVMIGEINQSNLYLLLPSKVSWLADMVTTNKGISLIDAIKQIYSSDTYKRLENEETKMWHWGPVDLYNEMISKEAGRE